MPDFDLDLLDLTATADPSALDRVREIVTDATEADGVAPVNEEFLLSLSGGAEGSRLAIERGGSGFAMATGDELVVVVRAAARGEGLGRALASALVSPSPDRPWSAWAHGDLPAARRLLTGLGFEPVRVLLRMGRDLAGVETAADRSPQPPPGVVIRSFRVGEDEERFLAANAAAFAEHPEQGALDLAGLRARMATSWFDPDGLLLAEDGTGELLGFHWTKRVSPSVGEVYVLGLVPASRGRGLAGVLLSRGLSYLHRTGAREVELYVDEDNSAAVRLYEGLGFIELDRDVRYVRKIHR
jgi:mycothiol synthase